MPAPLALVWDLIARDAASPAFARVGAAADGAAASTERAAASTEAAGARMATAFGVVAAGAVVALGVKSAEMATKFQASMLTIQTQAGASSAEVAKMSDAVLKLAGPLGTAPEQLATSLYHAYSVTKDTASALDIMKTAAEGAKVGHSDLEQTTNALTSTVASGIPGVKNMAEAMGALNATVGAGDMKMQDLNEALGSGVLTVVKGYGLSMRDVGAALATFGDNNIRGANAATMLRMAVQAMAVPAKGGDAILKALGVTTGQVDQALQKYGITGKQLALDMQHGGLNQALTDLRSHLDDAGVKSNQVGEIVTTAFGKKAGPGVAVLLSQFDRFQSKLKAVQDGAGGFGSAWDATQKTASFAFDKLRATVDALMIRLGTQLLPILADLAKGFTSAFGFILDHGSVFGLFATTLGVAAVAILAVVSAVKLAAAAQAIWNGYLLVFDAEANANPVGIIITAIAALVAGLIYAYTHFKGFREVCNDVFHAVATAAKWLWDNALHPMFTALTVAVDFVKDHWRTFAAVLAVALAPITIGIAVVVLAIKHWSDIVGFFKTAWSNVWAAVVAVWNVAAPILAIIGKVFYAVLGGIVLLAIESVKVGWGLLWTSVAWTWDHIGKPVFDVIKTVALWLYEHVLSPTFKLIALEWGILVDALQWAWDHVGKPVWDAIETAANWLYDHILKPIFDKIGGAWSDLWNGVKSAWDTIWGFVTVAITAGVNTAIDLMNGLLGAVNWVLNKLPGGLKIDLIPHIGATASDVKDAHGGYGGGGSAAGGMGQTRAAAGGVLPGWSPGQDDMHFFSPQHGWLHLAGGEGILTPQAAKMLGGEDGINALNAKAQHFAAGGMFYPQMFNVVKGHFPDAILNDGYRPGANDYHGLGQAVDIGWGKQPYTVEGSPFLASVKQWLADSFGGKTAELIYDGINDNRPDLKNGRPLDYGAVTSSQHHNHVHWALNALSDIQGGGGGLVGTVTGNAISGLNNILGISQDAANAAIDTAVAAVHTGASAMPEVLQKMVNAGTEFMVSPIRQMIGDQIAMASANVSQGDAPGAVGDHLALIKQALQLAGIADNGANEAAVNTIVQYESGWNPSAKNLTDSNAMAGHPSEGLMQTIPSTFNAYRLASLSNNIDDPLSNMVAGIRYAVARYGSLLSVPGVRAINAGGHYVGYDNGGWLEPGVTPSINLTGKPEAILTADQWQTMKSAAAGNSGAQVIHIYDVNNQLIGTMRGVAKSAVGSAADEAMVRDMAGSRTAGVFS